MVSRSRLNTPATPSPQTGPDPSYVRLSCKYRRSLGEQQVEYVDYEGGVHQKRHDHARQPPAAQLDGVRQEPAVEPDEQRRVEEHHEPAPRRGEDQQYERLDARPDDYRAPDGHDPHDRDIDLALAPELALLEEVHLQRVGGEPADPVHDPDVGREEDREAGQVEEVLEPGPQLTGKGLGFLLEKGDIGLPAAHDAQGRVEEHRETDERRQAQDVEGEQLLLVCHLPPVPPAAHVLFVELELVTEGRSGFLLAGDRRDDLGHEYPHAQALVADVVALHEVVATPSAGKDYRPEYRRGTELIQITGQVRRALWSLRDDARPGRCVGGDDYGHQKEDHDDGDQHHLDLLQGVVDHRREGHREGDGEQEYGSDDRNGTFAQAEEVGEHSGSTGRPAGEGVR